MCKGYTRLFLSWLRYEFLFSICQGHGYKQLSLICHGNKLRCSYKLLFPISHGYKQLFLVTMVKNSYPLFAMTTSCKHCSGAVTSCYSLFPIATSFSMCQDCVLPFPVRHCYKPQILTMISWYQICMENV